MALSRSRINSLVNNAGVMLRGPVVRAPMSECQQMVELKVLGLLDGAHAGRPHLPRTAEDRPRRVAEIVNISSVAGQAPSSVHLAGRAGAAATELANHNRPGVLETMRTQITGMAPMQAKDIADAISYTVARPRHVAINEMLIRPIEQE